jgi:hypothetical protein
MTASDTPSSSVPGLNVPIELRLAPKAAAATLGYHPVNLASGDLENFHQWIEHLDALQSPTHRSCPPTQATSLSFRSSDGLYLRVLTLHEGGIQSIEMNRDVPEPQGAWMAPDIMRHPYCDVLGSGVRGGLDQVRLFGARSGPVRSGGLDCSVAAAREASIHRCAGLGGFLVLVVGAGVAGLPGWPLALSCRRIRARSCSLTMAGKWLQVGVRLAGR